MDELSTPTAPLQPELPPPPARCGASGAPEAGDHDELPLIVWLRGDEPYFSDFSLSADEVMASLGIKRSRLTQIAGRELRVGRTRVDRYIRPVFRPCDIEAYLSWTRATASHKKSSVLLEQAADKLAHESKGLAQQWSEHYEEWRSDLFASLRYLHQQQEKNLQAWLTIQHRTLRRESQHASEGGNRALVRLSQELAALAAHSTSAQAEANAALQRIEAALIETLGRVQYLEKAMSTLSRTAEQASAEQAAILEQLAAGSPATTPPAAPRSPASPMPGRLRPHAQQARSPRPPATPPHGLRPPRRKASR